MAYTRKRTWIEDGPSTVGGLSGLGQACDSTNFAAMTTDQMVNCGYMDPTTGVLTPPTVTPSLIPNIPNTYLYLAAAVLGLPILMGLFRSGR